jgi:hypothetical protein
MLHFEVQSPFTKSILTPLRLSGRVSLSDSGIADPWPFGISELA